MSMKLNEMCMKITTIKLWLLQNMSGKIGKDKNAEVGTWCPTLWENGWMTQIDLK
mgnify:CR=1 FL=1